MKILYISPENIVGTLTLWKNEHIKRGNECRTVTFFHSPKGFEEDICLNLPFNFTKPILSKMRNIFYKNYRGKEGYFKQKEGCPPIWQPEGWLDRLFLSFKDSLWRPIVEKAIADYELYDFDVVHFESGVDFLKNEFFSRELKKRNKKIICHYHGEDLRSRGVMPYIDTISDLNLTNEVDLLDKHPKIEYLFLPFKTSGFQSKIELNNRIRISHAPTNRYYKGSDVVISICEKLQSEGKIKFDLIENLPHSIALSKKLKSDIFIDQIGNKGGWGYGMNSVESLSMGICTLTEMNDTYNSFIPDHPFISVSADNLEIELRSLLNNRERIMDKGKEGKVWVKNNHDIKSVADKLYNYYAKIGLS